MRGAGPTLPGDAIPLTLRHGLVCSEAGDLTVIDSVHKTAVVSTAAQVDGGALVLGFANSAGKPLSTLDVTVGQLRYSRRLACARNKLWWMTPEWGTPGGAVLLPPETQFLLLESEEDSGPYMLLLPLIDGPFRAALRSVSSCLKPTSGDVCLRVESGDNSVSASKWDALLYVAAGRDPYALIERGVAAAARLSGGARPLSEKVVPPLLDHFGWCTWDAFYSTVSATGLRQGLQSLHDGGVRPGFLIIDDGWQMTDVDPPLLPAASELASRLHLDRATQALEGAEDVFYAREQAVLGKVARRMPSDSAAGRMLQPAAERKAPSMTHPHHHPDGAARGPAAPHPPGKGPKALARAAAELAAREAIWLVRLAQGVAGFFAGLFTAAFVVFYQRVVEPAAPGSLVVRLFTAAANGRLRGAMLGFFAASTDFSRRLTSVRANGKFSGPDAAPDGDWQDREERLGEVVADVKAKFGVKQVYCWHGLPAYWAGVMPNAPGVAKYQAHLVFAKPSPSVLEVEPSMAWSPAALAGVGVVDDPAAIYTDMHRYLAAANVDGVKVDCQAGVGLVGGHMGGSPALSARFQAALEASVATHFKDNSVINCMCHTTENLYRMTATALVRASDDFYPRDPASFAPHIAACAYNSVFLSPLLQPDWDMFQSKHPAARMHAMARTVSGGAVYVSDKVGEHDYALLKQLVLPDGTVLRAQQPGRPTRDCLFKDVSRDGQSLLKVWNTNRVNAMVGVFHVQGSSWDRSKRKFFIHDKSPRPSMISVRPCDIEPWRSAVETAAAGSGGSSAAVPCPPKQYVAHSFVTGDMTVLGYDNGVEVLLWPADSDMITLAPVLDAGGGAGFAPVGLVGMMNTGGAIIACALLSPVQRAAAVAGSGQSQPSGAEVERAAFGVTVRGCGRLLLYATHRPRFVLVGGVGAPSTFDGCKVLLDIPETTTLVSEVSIVF